MNKILAGILGYTVAVVMTITAAHSAYTAIIDDFEYKNPINIEYRALKKVQDSLELKMDSCNNKFEKISKLYEKGTITDSTLEETVVELKNKEANYLIASQKLKSFEKTEEYQRAQYERRPSKVAFAFLLFPLASLTRVYASSKTKKEDEKWKTTQNTSKKIR